MFKHIPFNTINASLKFYLTYSWFKFILYTNINDINIKLGTPGYWPQIVAQVNDEQRKKCPYIGSRKVWR